MKRPPPLARLVLILLVGWAVGYLLVLLFHAVDSGGIRPVPKTKNWTIPKER